MQIDFTKEEWEFLKRSLRESIELFSRHFPDEYKISQSYKLNEKLGSEWIDDEYCLKCKNETVACVCMGDGND